MNTFALILLAFPFYLLTKGRFTAYTNLATQANQTADTTGAVSSANPTEGGQDFGVTDSNNWN